MGRPAHDPIDDLKTTREKYVSLAQLAHYIGCARRTLYYHRDKGALRVIKRVGVIRVPIAEARRYAGLS